MGSRHLGELLLRPSSFRTLSVSQTSTAISQQLRTPCFSQRSFSTSIPIRAAQSQFKPAAEQRSESQSQPNARNSATPLDDTSDGIRSRTQKSDADVSSTIDSLFSSGTDKTPRRSERSSSDEFGAAARNRSAFGANFSKMGGQLGRQPLKWDDMLDVPSAMPAQPTPQTPMIKEEDIVYPRLDASTGRAVELDPSRGRDIVRGLNMLGSLMARNRVKRDFQMQRFHERPGLKRKRLKSERWRARFKIGFDATCKRVSELTKKGW